METEPPVEAEPPEEAADGLEQLSTSNIQAVLKALSFGESGARAVVLARLRQKIENGTNRMCSWACSARGCGDLQLAHARHQYRRCVWQGK